MSKISRRSLLGTGLALTVPPGLLAMVSGCNQSNTNNGKQAESNQENKPKNDNSKQLTKADSMKIQYLEIVTPEVDALCRQYSAVYDITFGEADPSLGNARTAKLEGGGMIGIRGPMRETETPVVRPYLLVDDIKAAVEAAEKSGAKVAMNPMEIPNHGMFAIVIHGGIDCGFWQT